MHDDFQAWRAELALRGFSTDTVRGYGYNLENFRVWCAARGIAATSDITSALVSEYIAGLRARGQAPASVKRHVNALSALCKWLRGKGLVAEPVEFPRLHTIPSRLPRTVSLTEVEQLLGACGGSNFAAVRDRAMIEFLYSTGARASELCAIGRRQVDLDRGVALLYGKGRKERVAQLGEPACDAIRSWFTLWRDRARSASDALFLTKEMRALTRSRVWKIIARRANAAGLRGRLSPHVLRHTCATHMIEGKADLISVQRILGHSSPTTTQIYIHVSGVHIADAHRSSHPRALRAASAARTTRPQR